jgi:hypothetical protein
MLSNGVSFLEIAAIILAAASNRFAPSGCDKEGIEVQKMAGEFFAPGGHSTKFADKSREGGHII